LFHRQVQEDAAMTDELRPPSPRPDDEEPQEELEEAEEKPAHDLGIEPDPTIEPQPVYGRSAERHLGREIPLWVVAIAALFVVVVIVSLFSLIGGGAPAGTPTPDATAVAQQATMTALATTPTPEPATPTPTPVSEPVLEPGAKAEVINSEPEGVRLRSGPGRNTLTKGIFKDGTIFELLPKPSDVTEYPVKADGYVWWRVRAANGAEGWVAEGDNKASWLKPLPANPMSSRSSQ
jgi:hypothetical protein